MKAVIGLDKVKNELINMDANKLYALARKALMENQPDEILTHYNEARRYRDDYDTKDFINISDTLFNCYMGIKVIVTNYWQKDLQLLQIRSTHAYRVIRF